MTTPAVENTTPPPAAAPASRGAAAAARFAAAGLLGNRGGFGSLPKPGSPGGLGRGGTTAGGTLPGGGTGLASSGSDLRARALACHLQYTNMFDNKKKSGFTRVDDLTTLTNKKASEPPAAVAASPAPLIFLLADCRAIALDEAFAHFRSR